MDSSRAVRPGSIGGVVLDGAGWHRSQALQMPKNLRLVALPPCSPELNPREPVFQHLKANRFSNRVFRDAPAVQQSCQETWDWFCRMPEQIASLLRRSWGTAAEASCNLVPGPSEPANQCV